MSLSDAQAIAECKREAKKLGFIFTKTNKIQDGEAIFKFTYSSGEMYREVNLGIAYEIVCSDELKNAVRPVGRPSLIKNAKRFNLYLDVQSLEIAAKLGDGNVSEGIRKALQAQT